MNPGITSIVSNAITPPVIDTYYGNALAFFNGVNWDTPVYVPCESVSAYRAALGWSYFTNILCNDPTNTMEYGENTIQIYSIANEIVVSGAYNSPVVISSIDGRTIATIPKSESQSIIRVPASGVYIVRVGTHKAQKVVVQ